jgi:hypothetical protein
MTVKNLVKTHYAQLNYRCMPYGPMRWAYTVEACSMGLHGGPIRWALNKNRNSV